MVASPKIPDRSSFWIVSPLIQRRQVTLLQTLESTPTPFLPSPFLRNSGRVACVVVDLYEGSYSL